MKKQRKAINLKIYQVAGFKLVVVSIVFLAVTVCSLVVNIYLTTATPEHYSSLNLNTIACHGGGVELATNCDRFEDVSEVLPIHVFSSISLGLQSCISLVTLLINSNYSKYSTFLRTMRNKFSSSQ